MNILTDIPTDQLEHFKSNVKQWLELDEQIKELEKKAREMKAIRNKQLEPKITGFMNSYNISDLNTGSGKLRCNERKTKAPINKKTIQESLQRVLSQEQANSAFEEIYLNRQVITKYKLSRVKK